MEIAQILSLHSPMRLRLLVTIVLLLGSTMSFAQTPAQPQAASTAPSVASEVDTYAKIVVAALTGTATLLGLPILLLTYRKTRAEISKLELEANALREQQGQQEYRSRDEEGNIRILVDRSPNTNIEVLADPRFLAPLLILLDFILAWIVLTLAGYLFSVFPVDFLPTFGLAVLAAILLLPIAREVLRVRSVLRPPATPEEANASLRQSKIAGYTTYAIFALMSLVFGVLLLTVTSNEPDWVRYIAWTMIALSALMIIFIPVAKARFDRYLDMLQQ